MTNHIISACIDRFSENRVVSGWIKLVPPADNFRPIITLQSENGILGSSVADRPRSDLKDCSIGFELRSGQEITSADLSSGSVWASVTDPASGTQLARMAVWEGIRNLDYLEIENPEFLNFIHSKGIKISGPLKQLKYGIKIEAPVVLQFTEIDHLVKIGAFTGIYGRGRGQLYHASIGRYCSIAPGFSIGLNEHPTDRISSSGVFYAPRSNWENWVIDQGWEFRIPRPGFNDRPMISIGNDVFIGANVTIRRGVTIGDGAVVGAGSFVGKNVEPYSIVGGVPAKHIRYRFPENIRQKLCEVRWWDYNIFPHENLPPNNVEKFLENISILIDKKEITKLPSHYVSLGDMRRDWTSTVSRDQ